MAKHTIYNFLRHFCPFLLLKMLHQAMRMQRVRDRAVKAELYSCGRAVCGHYCCVHLHFLGRVVMFGGFVPGNIDEQFATAGVKDVDAGSKKQGGRPAEDTKGSREWYHSYLSSPS